MNPTEEVSEMCLCVCVLVQLLVCLNINSKHGYVPYAAKWKVAKEDKHTTGGRAGGHGLDDGSRPKRIFYCSG